MIKLTGKRTEAIDAEIQLPLSKSESNRYLILSALNNELPVSYSYSEAEDSQLMHALLSQKHNRIDCGKAGTVLRFLIAYHAINDGSEVQITGDTRMLKRPVKDLVDALRKLGANIEYLNKEGYPPLKVHGRSLEGGSVSISSSLSSQYISALMLIAPKLRKGLEIFPEGTDVSSSYIEMTAEILRNSGVNVEMSEGIILVSPSAIKLDNVLIARDWSSAAFWYQLVALSENGSILLKELSFPSIQGDSHLLKFFEAFGVKSEVLENGIRISKVEVPDSNELVFDCKTCPDIVPSLLLTAVALEVKCIIKGISHLRLKESDRVGAMAVELNKFGVNLVTDENTIRTTLEPMRKPEEGVIINTYNDHRIAMAFAPLAMKFTPLTIENWEVVYKSYPNYWDEMKKFFLLET